MPAADVIAYAEENRKTFESELAELLAIPSISALSERAEDCTRAAQWLAGRLARSGMENVEGITGPGHPLVYADWLHAEGKPTVLIYGHYDVQPVDPVALWDSDPFQATVRDGYLYARGAVDDKGQVAALVDAAASYLAAGGGLPLNIRFLIEGEEESGGEHIKRFLESRDPRLSADFVHVSDSSFFNLETPSITTGLRGIVYAEVFVKAVDHDLHSGEYGGVAPNPLISLAHIISRLRDEQGNITIPGFFDDVAAAPEQALQSWQTLDVTAESLAREIGARRIIGDPAYSPVERMWTRPTLDVHGIPGGFTGEGGKTVIPAQASAKISMRLVPNQKADVIFERFEEWVRRVAPDDVAVEVGLLHGDDPVAVPEETPEIEAAKEAIRRVWGKEPILQRSGGSIPIVGHFQQELGLGTVLMGYGLPGDNLHAPNERFLLDQFHKGIQANILFWDLVAQRH